MKLIKIPRRKIPPEFSDVYAKIPWNDPGFSQRMLDCHLSQEHDWASRRIHLIDQHVHWLSQRFPNKKARILDLGCGPGLYTQRLAKLGYDCVGIDFSPASIAYAKQQAANENLSIEYILDDIRHHEISGAFDLVMMVFGEFNVFKENEAASILEKTSSLLKDDGFLVIEAHTFEEIQRQGELPPSWQAMEKGLFLDCPHICLQEHFWDESKATTIIRFYIVDAETAAVQEYGSTLKAYTDEQYHKMFEKAGMYKVQKLPDSEWPVGELCEGKLQVMVGRKNINASVD